jgi:DNA-binding protein HU-beta
MQKVLMSDGDLTKDSLTSLVADVTGVSKPVTAHVLETAFDAIAKRVASGYKVTVSNFGSWGRIERPERFARNPQNGERILVEKRNDVKFHPAARFVAFTNSDRPEEATIRKIPKGQA